MLRSLASHLCLLGGYLSAWALQVNPTPDPVVDYWVSKSGDVLRTGASPYTVPSELEKGPTWSWNEEKNGVVRASPIIDKDLNIYITTARGKIVKFDSYGKILWTHEVSSLPGVPSIMDGLLYTCTSDAYVYALSCKDGSEVWKIRIANITSGDTWSMTAAEGIVVAGAVVSKRMAEANNDIVAIDAKRGVRLWSYYTEGELYNMQPSISEGNLIFSDSRGRLYRIELQTGHIIYRTPPPPEAGKSTGSAVIGPNGAVYVTSNAATGLLSKAWGMAATLTQDQIGLVSAYDFDTGDLLWRKELPMQANSAPAVGYLTPGGRLSVAIGAGMNPNPPILPEVIKQINLPRTKPGRIYTLDAGTGKLGWEYELPDLKERGAVAAGDWPGHTCLPDAFSAPAIGGDGTLYFGFANGNLYAIRDKNKDGFIDPQTEASSYNFKNAFQGSPAIAPGLLVVAPCNGLHVFDGRKKGAEKSAK